MTIASYEWTFGGRVFPGTGEQTTRVFERSGTCEVELTIVDAAGTTDTETDTIEVAPPVWGSKRARSVLSERSSAQLSSILFTVCGPSRA